MLVDDEVDTLEGLSYALQSKGVDNIIICQDSRSVMKIMEKKRVEVVAMDIKMPHITGDKLLASITDRFPETKVIMVTADNSLDSAISCLKNGAIDYLTKPVEINRFVTVVKRSLQMVELQRENQLLKKSLFSGELDNPEAFSSIITRNPKMIGLFKYIESIAKSPYPVLITGETGVGKELFARAVHTLSRRRGKFATINVAGLDDNMFSDTLFGHVKGAFTGADQSRNGLLDSTAGGTLVMDEIGDLEERSQVKLLRLLEYSEYYPIGMDVVKLASSRFILCTNSDLERKVEEGTFRKDLYFRLKSHKITPPPLRDRLDDLEPIIQHFIKEVSANLRKTPPSYSPELIDTLSRYHFPGNVRELQQMIIDAVSSASTGVITSNSLGMLNTKGMTHERGGRQDALELDSGLEVNKALKGILEHFNRRIPKMKDIEKLMIDEAMIRTGGNRSAVAKMLGLSRSTLIKRLADNEKQNQDMRD